MANIDSTNEETPEGVEPEAKDSQGQEPEDETKTNDESETATEDDAWDGLPEKFAWVRKSLKDANKEAAGYRVKYQETQGKLQEAKTPEEVAQILKEQQQATDELRREVEVERAKNKYALTDDMVQAFLSDVTDPDKIDIKARALAAVAKGQAPEVPPGPRDLSGGRNPHGDSSTLSGLTPKQIRQNALKSRR